MGFNDQEIVALSGAHALGRCHTDRSGYDGPWSFSPTTFSNSYFQLLLSESWVEKKWKGPRQFVDKKTGSLMMLPTDMELIRDKVRTHEPPAIRPPPLLPPLFPDQSFKVYVDLYSKDQAKFFSDFAAVRILPSPTRLPSCCSKDLMPPRVCVGVHQIGRIGRFVYKRRRNCFLSSYLNISSPPMPSLFLRVYLTSISIRFVNHYNRNLVYFVKSIVGNCPNRDFDIRVV